MRETEHINKEQDVSGEEKSYKEDQNETTEQKYLTTSSEKGKQPTAPVDWLNREQRAQNKGPVNLKTE